LEALHIKAVSSSVDSPVNVPRVIAKFVLTVVRKLDAMAPLGGKMAALTTSKKRTPRSNLE